MREGGLLFEKGLKGGEKERASRIKGGTVPKDIFYVLTWESTATVRG